MPKMSRLQISQNLDHKEQNKKKQINKPNDVLSLTSKQLNKRKIL